MAHPLLFLEDWPLAECVRRAGVGWPPPADAAGWGRVNCPHCGTEAALAATPDPHHPSAWWFACAHCSFAGDQCALVPGHAAGTWQGGLRVGVPGEFADKAARTAYLRYSRARTATQRAARRGPHHNVTATSGPLLTEVGVPLPAPAAGLWFAARYGTVRRSAGLRAGGCTKQAAIALPVWDLPGRAQGFLTRYSRATRKPNFAWSYDSWAAGTTAHTGGVYGLTWEAARGGRDGFDHPPAWAGHTVVVTNPADYYRLHTAHHHTSPGRLAPIVGLVGAPKAQAAAAALLLPRACVLWARPADFSVYHAAARLGARVFHAEWDTAAAADHPAWLAERIHHALPWPAALTRELQAYPPRVLHAALGRLEWDDTLAALAGPAATRLVETHGQVVGVTPTYVVGPYRVRATPHGLLDAATGRMLCDTELFLDTVSWDDGIVYRGKLVQYGQTVAVAVSAARLRGDYAGTLEELCLRTGLEVPVVDADFARMAYQAALTRARPRREGDFPPLSSP